VDEPCPGQRWHHHGSVVVEVGSRDYRCSGDGNWRAAVTRQPLLANSPLRQIAIRREAARNLAGKTPPNGLGRCFTVTTNGTRKLLESLDFVARQIVLAI
jgi:hypothetical protein